MDTWIPYSNQINRASLVKVGNDGDGSPMYVGRAHHSGDNVPGKVLKGNNCHISYNGQEISKNAFEVLLDKNYTWERASNGNVPQKAVVGGYTISGETLYIGRASHCGIITPGKIHPSHKCLYLPFGWKEHRYTDYEVLVSPNSGWAPCPPNPCPPPHQGPPNHHRPHFPPGPPHHHHPHHPPHHRHRHDSPGPPHRKC